MRISSLPRARVRAYARGLAGWRDGEMQVGEPISKPPLTCTAPWVTCIAPTGCPRQGSLTCIAPRQMALTCILTEIFPYTCEPVPTKDNDEEFAVNRTDLIKAATEDIDLADAPGSNYNYQSMRYLGAIAKLLLAQALDAPASPPRDTDLLVAGLCTVCARPRRPCNCGARTKV